MVKKLCEEAIHRRKSGDCTWQTRHGNGGLLQREERLDAAAAHTSCAPCRCLRLCQFAACTAWHLWTLRWAALLGMMASPSYLSRLSCPTRRDHKDHSEVVYELEMQLVSLLFQVGHLWALRWAALPGMMVSPTHLSRLSCPTRRDHKDHSEVVYEFEMQLVLLLFQVAACTAWHLWTLRWGVLPGMMASPSYLSRLSCPTRRDHKDHSEVVYELEMQLVPLLFRRQHAPIAHVQQKPCRVRTTLATVATEVELASAILPTLMVSARSSTRSSRACKRADRGCWADEKAGAEPVVPGAAAACLLL